MTRYGDVLGEVRAAWQDAVDATRRTAEAARALLASPARLDGLEQALGVLQRQVEGLGGRLGEVEEAMREAAEALEAREEAEGRLGAEMGALRSQLGSLAAAVEGVQAAVRGLDERLSELEDAFRRRLEMERDALRQLAEGGAGLVAPLLGAEGQGGPLAAAEAAQAGPAAVAEGTWGDAGAVAEDGQGEEMALAAAEAPEAGYAHEMGVEEEAEDEAAAIMPASGNPEADARRLKERLEERRRMLEGERRGLRRFLRL